MSCSKRLSTRSLSYALIATTTLFLLSFIVTPELLSSSTHAEPGVVPIPTLTIGSSNSIALSVTPGQFTSGSQNITVETTNYTGYTMTIAPTSGESTDLVNSAVDNATIPSISSTLSTNSFTNLSTAAYGISTDNSTYKPVTSGTTINSTNGPTDSTTGSFTLTLGAKTQTNTPAGSYEKSFTLTATANPAVFAITYNKNTEDNTSNMPSANEGTMTGTNLVLSSKTPTRTGYKFLHWNTAADDTGTSYNVSDTYILDPELGLAGNTITLYAIWGCGNG